MFGLIPPNPAPSTKLRAPHSIAGEIAIFTNALILEKSMYRVHDCCCRLASGTASAKLGLTITCPSTKSPPFLSELQNCINCRLVLAYAKNKIATMVSPCIGALGH